MNINLNLWDLFINKIFGPSNEGLFLAAFFLLIAFFSAYLRMPNQVTISVIAVCAVIMAAFFNIILAVVLFVVGLLFALTLSRWTTRG